MPSGLFPQVVVNGEVVPRALIAAEAQHHPAPKEKPGLAWRAAARALAVRTLLLQEARRQRLPARPEELGEGRHETEDEALIRAVIEAGLTPPAEAVVQTEWARDPARFRSPPLWEVSHILIACDASDLEENEAARARAQTLADLLVADPSAFSRLARQESDCASRNAGGALGQIGPGDAVPEFEVALRRLDVGETTLEPVRTRFGWHLIRMDSVAEGRELPYEVVRPRIREALEKAAWARTAHDLIARLAAAADVQGVDLELPTGGHQAKA